MSCQSVVTLTLFSNVLKDDFAVTEYMVNFVSDCVYLQHLTRFEALNYQQGNDAYFLI